MGKLKTICKNCFHEITEVYCSHCGQKHIVRIHFRDFLDDFLGSMFSFHGGKGLFATLWELVVRPKKAVFDYIHGKRQKYYNPASLFVIFSGLYFFFGLRNADTEDVVGRILAADFFVITAILSGLFVTALLTYFLFRKYKLNFSEHLIFALYYFSVFFFVSVITNLFGDLLNVRGATRLYVIFSAEIVTFYFYLRVFKKNKILGFLKIMLLVFFKFMLGWLIPASLIRYLLENVY